MNRHRIAHQIKSQPSENISLSHKFTAFCRGMRHHWFYNLTQNTLSAWHFFPYGTQGNFKRKKIKTGKDFFNHVKKCLTYKFKFFSFPVATKWDEFCQKDSHLAKIPLNRITSYPTQDSNSTELCAFLVLIATQRKLLRSQKASWSFQLTNLCKFINVLLLNFTHHFIHMDNKVLIFN